MRPAGMGWACCHRLVACLICLFVWSIHARQWPYDRYDGVEHSSGQVKADTSSPTIQLDAGDKFTEWLSGVMENDPTGQLKKVFHDGKIPEGTTAHNLMDAVKIPNKHGREATDPILLQPSLGGSAAEAASLFKNLGYELEPDCISDKATWWYRTYDGSCNWLRANQSWFGAIGTAKARDYDQTTYKDGYNSPREGPNPRALSNAFFKRKERIYYEHTPLLLGLIEFIMHDVTYSQDSNETITVPMPDDEQDYPLDTVFKVPRTISEPSTGTPGNPRQIVNGATTWLDLSALYGSTKDVAEKLRTFQGGKLKAQRTTSLENLGEYLPFNTPDMEVPMNGHSGIDQSRLFAGGDPRTNEDWILLGVHTLLLREHNRLCEVLAKRRPEFASDDERLYQTVRLLLSAKYAMIANSYQMAYWTEEMPWPRDDGFPLYRQMYGKSEHHINPANTYPWPLVTKGNKPMIVSAEMSVVYRFHEFIISHFPIKDKNNNTLFDQDLFSTTFNATGFIDVGLEPILRGITASTIPNFKSGVDEAFRSAGSRNSAGYRGSPFDVATWSIVHEREQGLPTFNQYFTKYNEQKPHVKVPIRKKFSDFTKDADAARLLQKLYNSPDDVDLVVGVQLDDDMFPGTTVPLSALIVSLFSLFGMGNSDRFSIGFAMMRCLLVDKPWNCRPTNALDDLLWAPRPTEVYPNLRMLDPFWIAELDLQAHGSNLLWRLITENTHIPCLQRNPMFPFDPKTNPILCELPADSWWYNVKVALVSAREIIIALIRQGLWQFFGTVAASVLLIVRLLFRRKPKLPSLSGWPVLGVALQFQKDPLRLFKEGMQKFGGRVFGLKLASMTHYVVTRPEDFTPIADDPYELRFSLHGFFKAINFDLVTLGENFETDVHTKLIRDHFSDPSVLRQLAGVIDLSAREYLEANPLLPASVDQIHLDGLNKYFSQYINYVMSRCIVGPYGYDNKDLLEVFLKFNDDALRAMGLSSLLPRFLRFIPAYLMKKDFNRSRKVLVPIIAKRRSRVSEAGPDFMNKTMKVVNDDQRVADLVAIASWVGLTNLQATFSSSAWDIINTADLQTKLNPNGAAKPDQLSVLERQEPWSVVRSTVLESIRLCGPIVGPSRITTEDYNLPSEPTQHIPKGQVITLSSYYTHRQESVWGADAAQFDPQRFLNEDPPIATERFITWGLRSPHLCPGRWLALETIQILALRLFAAYSILPDKVVPDAEKYKYSGGIVVWKDVGVTVKRNK